MNFERNVKNIDHKRCNDIQRLVYKHQRIMMNKNKQYYEDIIHSYIR